MMDTTEQLLVVRYDYRLRVSSTVERTLVSEYGLARWVWNRCVEESREANRISTPENPVHCGLTQLGKALTKWRSENEWLRSGSQDAQQQMVREFTKTRSKAMSDIKNKFPPSKRNGFPKFKSRHRALPSLQYSKNGFSLKEDGSGKPRLHLPHGVVVRPVWSRDLPSEPTSVNVYRDACGDWWCSFVVRVAVETLPSVNSAIGIDWGVTETATTTDDAFDLKHAQHGKSSAAKLAHYQRMMARRKPPRGHVSSKGYSEAKKSAARLHRTIERQRTDNARKWAKSVVRNFDQIAVEDFKPQFLSKTTMARKSADAAIGATKRELIHMASKHGRDLRLIDPRFTTMDCANCGARTKHPLPLSERMYHCDECGVSLPRDKNSALVMLNRAGFNPADVDRGRLDGSLAHQAA